MKPKFYIEFLDDGPDEKGRRRFFLDWFDEGDPKVKRGQIFFAKPENYGFSVDGIRLEKSCSTGKN